MVLMLSRIAPVVLAATGAAAYASVITSTSWLSVWVTETVTYNAIVATPAETAGSLSSPTVAPSTTGLPILASGPTAFNPAPAQPSVASPSQIVTTTTTFLSTVMSTISVSVPKSTVTISKTTWASPAKMTDLSAFKISFFSSGKDNVRIVNIKPTEVEFASSSAPENEMEISSNSTNDVGKGHSMLQVFYPRGSVNPAGRPIGGAQFYAVPLDVATARNITLQYSVYFPADFNWVQGGKMPGLYGGRRSCSGGDEARDCFSTRLMWRRNGAGELYLYAPKDEQTWELCHHPQSVCDMDYGLSVGRGSFYWNRGAWTTVQQTVVLNTPGKQDGIFTLLVNGKQVIHRADVFYRSKPRRKEEGGSSWSKRSRPGAPVPDAEEMRTEHEHATYLDQGDIVFIPARPQVNESLTADSSVAPQVPFLDGGEGIVSVSAAERKPIGFVGLFFSTFFGGHDTRFATPRDQYAWFKDFVLIREDRLV